MRLLVVSNLFFPDRGGGASVFSDLCLGLQARGWEVTVYTTHPYYPEWKRKDDASPWRIQQETWEGVKVFRHGIFVPEKPSKLLPRLAYEVSFLLSLLRSTFRGPRYDAVMVYCPLLGAVMFGGVRRLLRREPLWLNVQDIPADAAAASGISRSGMFNGLADRVQRIAFNRADCWSTISPVMMERLAPMRGRDQPLHLCPNWLNGSLAEAVAALPSKVGRRPGSPLRLLYAGNIGKKQGLLDFCRRIAEGGSRFRFTIHGNGGEAGAVRQWVAESGDDRFHFGEFLDETGFTRALHEADVFVITEKSGSGASFIPSKLIPGIASGTPILAVCDRTGPLGREMAEAGLGKVVEWASIANLPATLEGISSSPDEFVRWQENCVGHSRRYHRDHAIARFATLIEEMASGRASAGDSGAGDADNGRGMEGVGFKEG